MTAASSGLYKRYGKILFPLEDALVGHNVVLRRAAPVDLLQIPPSCVLQHGQPNGFGVSDHHAVAVFGGLLRAERYVIAAQHHGDPPRAEPFGDQIAALCRIGLNGDTYEIGLGVIVDQLDAVVEKLGQRKGDLLEMNPFGNRMRIEYSIPARCLFGYRSEFMTDTRGEGILNTLFDGYKPFKGEVTIRFTGSLVASESGEATSYGLYNAQDRGAMFIGAAEPVYEGMIVGECPKNEDIAVNVCKKKHLTAIRSAGADEALRLIPPVIFSLEQAIEYIGEDELMEVTPKSLRLRKKILNTEMRLKAEAKVKKGQLS